MGGDTGLEDRRDSHLNKYQVAKHLYKRSVEVTVEVGAPSGIGWWPSRLSRLPARSHPWSWGKWGVRREG